MASTVTLKTWTKKMGRLRRGGILALGDGLVKRQSLGAKQHLEGATPQLSGLAKRSWALEMNGGKGAPVVLANRAHKPGSTDGYAQFIFSSNTAPVPGGLEPGLRRHLTSRTQRHLSDAEADVRREVGGG